MPQHAGLADHEPTAARRSLHRLARGEPGDRLRLGTVFAQHIQGPRGRRQVGGALSREPQARVEGPEHRALAGARRALDQVEPIGGFEQPLNRPISDLYCTKFSTNFRDAHPPLLDGGRLSA